MQFPLENGKEITTKPTNTPVANLDLKALDVEPRGSRRKRKYINLLFSLWLCVRLLQIRPVYLGQTDSLLVRKKPLYTFWWEKHKKYKQKPEPKEPLATYNGQRQNHTCGLAYAIILIG